MLSLVDERQRSATASAVGSTFITFIDEVFYWVCVVSSVDGFHIRHNNRSTSCVEWIWSFIDGVNPSPINLRNGCNKWNKRGIWNELSKLLSYVTTRESKWFWKFCRGWLENSGGRKVAGSSPVDPTGPSNLVNKSRTLAGRNSLQVSTWIECLKFHDWYFIMIDNSCILGFG